MGSTNKKKNFLRRFHNGLQVSVPHYTLGGHATKRRMLKYYEYRLRTCTLLREECTFNLRQNLEHFPIDWDPSLHIHHEKIAARIDPLKKLPAHQGTRNRYYIDITHHHPANLRSKCTTRLCRAR